MASSSNVISGAAGRIKLTARWFRGSMRFMRWWRQSLLSCIPERIRTCLGLDRGRVLLQPDGTDVRVHLQQLGSLGEIAAWQICAGPSDSSLPPQSLPAATADLPRWLLLPATCCLRRTISLPIAAETSLRQIAGYEIDRQTPFSRADVDYDVRVVERRDRHLLAELVVVPRAQLQNHLAVLGGSITTGLAGIDVAGHDGRPLDINLLPDDQRQQPAPRMRRWHRALIAAALAGASALMWQLLENERARAAALQDILTRNAEAERTVGNQRREWLALEQADAFMQQARRNHPPVLEIIEALSRSLPDNAYLEKLSVEDGRLTLIGFSDQAASLVQQLQTSPYWQSPALTGPLQPDARGRDRFTLTAQPAMRQPVIPDAPPPSAAGNPR